MKCVKKQQHTPKKNGFNLFMVMITTTTNDKDDDDGACYNYMCVCVCVYINTYWTGKLSAVQYLQHHLLLKVRFFVKTLKINCRKV